MDYAEKLRREAREAHAVFHQFALAISTAQATTLFFFFEGEEDPAFYMPHIIPRLKERRYHSLICYGRSEVLKAHELVERDGRGTRRALFFVDKDHTDLIQGTVHVPAVVYQTDLYSIESYLGCDAVFQRFWVERLHLSDLDPRFAIYCNYLRRITLSFETRCKVLTALILLGRGIDGTPPCKLNLNNVQLDRVFQLDIDSGTCRYRPGALKHFMAATNLNACPPAQQISQIKKLVRTKLDGLPPKEYIRGKYHLWLFWKVLILFTRELSDRESARKAGVRRATPSFPMCADCAVESLAPFVQCPITLDAFLGKTLAAA